MPENGYMLKLGSLISSGKQVVFLDDYTWIIGVAEQSVVDQSDGHF